MNKFLIAFVFSFLLPFNIHAAKPNQNNLSFSSIAPLPSPLPVIDIGKEQITKGKINTAVIYQNITEVTKEVALDKNKENLLVLLPNNLHNNLINFSENSAVINFYDIKKYSVNVENTDIDALEKKLLSLENNKISNSADLKSLQVQEKFLNHGFDFFTEQKSTAHIEDFNKNMNYLGSKQHDIFVKKTKIENEIKNISKDINL